MKINVDGNQAYISLLDSDHREVERSISLHDEENLAEAPAMGALVLDFDRQGKLVGIEVVDAQLALPDEVLRQQ